MAQSCAHAPSTIWMALVRLWGVAAGVSNGPGVVEARVGTVCPAAVYVWIMSCTAEEIRATSAVTWTLSGREVVILNC